MEQTLKETLKQGEKFQGGMGDTLERCQQADTKLLFHSSESAFFEQRLREEYEVAAKVMR